jgi:hypothetical protein
MPQYTTTQHNNNKKRKFCKQTNKKEVQMANKYMMIYSTSLTTREMQMKITMRFHLIPVRMAIIKKKQQQLGASGACL